MMLIAVFLALLATCSARIQLPPDVEEYVKDLHDTCLKKIGLTEDDHKGYDLVSKDPKIMCYMRCLMQDAKWMDSDEVIQYDFIFESTPVTGEVKDILHAALEKCREIEKGTQECEKAYNFNMCMQKADPENWFFV